MLNNPKPFVAILAFAVVQAFLWQPGVAVAETYRQYLERVCPNRVQIIGLRKKDDEAHAMMDNGRFDIERQLAREYYRCSTDINDQYGHDIALLFYGSSLYESLRTNGENDEQGPMVASRMNDLAAATKYADIRRLALKLKAWALKDAQDAHAAIYGSPTPAQPAYTPTPEETPQR